MRLKSDPTSAKSNTDGDSSNHDGVSTNYDDVCTNYVGVCTNYVGVCTNYDDVSRLQLPFPHLIYGQRQLFNGSFPSSERLKHRGMNNAGQYLNESFPVRTEWGLGKTRFWGMSLSGDGLFAFRHNRNHGANVGHVCRTVTVDVGVLLRDAGVAGHAADDG